MMKADAGKDKSRELIEKFVEGHYPEEIRRRFYMWLLAESGRKEKDRALESIWENAPCGDAKQSAGSLNIVKKRLGMPVGKVRPGRGRIMLRVAAVVVPVLLMAGGWWLVDRASVSDVSPAFAYNEAAAGEKVTLADHTVVDVKGGTLEYPAEFGSGERKVKLDGAGYFEVEKDERLPFVVESELLDVRVTGTRFMMSVEKENGLATVELYEGGVDVLIEGRDAVPLSPGNKLRYDAATGDVSVSILSGGGSGTAAIVYGKLVFDNAPLREIISAAARSRGYEAVIGEIHDPGKTYHIKFINNEDIEQILGVLNTLTDNGFSYTFKNNRIFIE